MCKLCEIRNNHSQPAYPLFELRNDDGSLVVGTETERDGKIIRHNVPMFACFTIAEARATELGGRPVLERRSATSPEKPSARAFEEIAYSMYKAAV